MLFNGRTPAFKAGNAGPIPVTGSRAWARRTSIFCVGSPEQTGRDGQHGPPASTGGSICDSLERHWPQPGGIPGTLKKERVDNMAKAKRLGTNSPRPIQQARRFGRTDIPYKDRLLMEKNGYIDVPKRLDRNMLVDEFGLDAVAFYERRISERTIQGKTYFNPLKTNYIRATQDRRTHQGYYTSFCGYSRGGKHKNYGGS